MIGCDCAIWQPCGRRTGRQGLAEYDGMARLEDFAVVNDRPLPEVATEILVAAGWIAAEL